MVLNMWVSVICLTSLSSFSLVSCRALKKVNDMKLARLNVDIKDFQPAGVPDLDGGAAPWVCIGKHLCGAATDFTLQCCTSSLHAVKHISQPPKQAVKPATVCSADQVHANSSTDRHTEVLSAATDAIQDSVRSASDSTAGRQSAAVVNCSTSPADRDISQARSLDADQENASSINSTQASYRSRQGLQGMAVATCCHHRCSWQHYVGKASFRELGFSPEDFEVMSWMTGLAYIHSIVSHALQLVSTNVQQYITGHSACVLRAEYAIVSLPLVCSVCD